MTRRPSIKRLLLRVGTSGYDRDAVVRGVAAALDAITPLGMVPGIGPVLELATDAIWMSAAEAIVAGVERAVERRRDAKAVDG